MIYIRQFEEIGIKDISLVGGKNASLGQMISALSVMGIKVPSGFALTAQAYHRYIAHNDLSPTIQHYLNQVSGVHTIEKLEEVSHAIKAAILAGFMPAEIEEEIVQAYKQLSHRYNQKSCDVAVRSSATAEDLPGASFAGQQETFLNIQGVQALLEACKKCIASLFTARAIAYRIEKGFDHTKVALSVGVQKMIRSDLASSGVAFSIDTETGFKDAVVINASFGLGESIVQGIVNPDEFVVHKPTLMQGYKSLIKKRLGDKKVKTVYKKSELIKQVRVAPQERLQWSLQDDEVLSLAQMVCAIEEYYSKIKNAWCPMDIEWAKDGLDNEIYIIQARPETIHSEQNQQVLHTYTLHDTGTKKTILTGQSIGQQIVSGTVRIIDNVQQIGKVQNGDVIVTRMTDPDWVPAMKKAAAIITEQGGRTCHAAIVSRELHIPALVGASDARKILKAGQVITLDCSQGSVGFVYDGKLDFEKKTIALDSIPKLSSHIMINCADPDSAFTYSFLPVDGIGLARIEFIITNFIKVHPCALLEFEAVVDKKIKKQIAILTQQYAEKKDFFIDQLAQGIGMLVAAFYPRTVIVRCSDFKTNEYRNLLGGSYFEPIEENPMLGLRGASRYYHQRFKEAFGLECAALKKVRDVFGLKNMKIMVPFVRTLKEAQIVVDELANHGLARGIDGLEIVMMCEIPSNVILLEQFAQYFDGFSIGSNDLTQLTLGVDRDSPELAQLFDERDEAVLDSLAVAIKKAHACKKAIGICGQAPSDYPKIAEFLLKNGITSLSLNPDSVIPFLMRQK